jgi:hypothetical protein
VQWVKPPQSSPTAEQTLRAQRALLRCLCTKSPAARLGAVARSSVHESRPNLVQMTLNPSQALSYTWSELLRRRTGRNEPNAIGHH